MLLRAAVLVAGLLLLPARASAEEWVFEPDTASARAEADFRFSGRLDVWSATFDRPPSACQLGGSSLPFQPSVSLCGGRSVELGLGAGGTVSFHALGPLHLTFGLDLLYSSPASATMRGQVLFAMPFALVLTEYSWAVRPIVQIVAAPMLYVTDDVRDYSLGADLGLAWRMLDWGDLSLTVGHHAAQTMDGWLVAIAVHPLP